MFHTEPKSKSPGLTHWTCAGLLLIAHTVALCLLAWRSGPVLDEPAHLAAGLSHLEFGRFDLYRVNPPLVRTVAAIPIWFADPATDWGRYSNNVGGRYEFDVGADFFRANGRHSLWLLAIARWVCVPFSLIGGAVCYRWSSDLYKSRAALFALFLWSSSPTILSWGATIVPDVAAASFGLLACYRFRCWLTRPTAPNAGLAGAALGAALLSKGTLAALLLVWPFLWVLVRRGLTDISGWRSRFREGMGLIAILALGVYLLNLGYGFTGSCRRLSGFEFVSPQFAVKQPDGRMANRFRDSPLGMLPACLPSDYVYGIDCQLADFDSKRWSYLCGEHRHGGWWYFYLFAAVVKEPLLLVGSLSLGLVLSIWRARTPRWREDVQLLVPLVGFVVLVSSQTGFSRYYRYLLPAVPFAIILASSVVDHFRTRVATAAVLAAGAWTTWSILSCFPHCHSYFNELAGGPARGHRYLVDSCIDWGQDITHVKQWLDAHPQPGPVSIAAYSPCNPNLFGITAELLPVSPNAPPAASDPRGVRCHIVHVNYLVGFRNSDLEVPRLTHYRALTPVDRVGYSYYVYILPLSQHLPD